MWFSWVFFVGFFYPPLAWKVSLQPEKFPKRFSCGGGRVRFFLLWEIPKILLVGAASGPFSEKGFHTPWSGLKVGFVNVLKWAQKWVKRWVFGCKRGWKWVKRGPLSNPLCTHFWTLIKAFFASLLEGGWQYFSENRPEAALTQHNSKGQLHIPPGQKTLLTWKDYSKLPQFSFGNLWA